MNLGALSAIGGALQGANQQEDAIRQHVWDTQKEAQEALLNNPQAHPGTLLSIINSTTGGIDPSMINDITSPNYFQGWKYTGPTKGIKTKDLVSGDNWEQIGDQAPGTASTSPSASPANPVISALVSPGGTVAPPQSPGNAPAPSAVPQGAGQAPGSQPPSQTQPNPDLIRRLMSLGSGNPAGMQTPNPMPAQTASPMPPQAQGPPSLVRPPGAAGPPSMVYPSVTQPVPPQQSNPLASIVARAVSQQPAASPQSGSVAPISATGAPTPPGVVGPIQIAGGSQSVQPNAAAQTSPVLQRLLGRTATPTMSDAVGLPTELAKYQMLTRGRYGIAQLNDATKSDIAQNKLVEQYAAQGDKDAIAVGAFANQHPGDAQAQSTFAMQLGRPDIAQSLQQQPIGETVKDTNLGKRADAYAEEADTRRAAQQSLAGLQGSEGAYYDAKTGVTVPQAQADILLKNAQAKLDGADYAMKALETDYYPRIQQNIMDYRTALGVAAGDNAATNAQNADTKSSEVAFNQAHWNAIGPKQQGALIESANINMRDLTIARSKIQAAILANTDPSPEQYNALKGIDDEMETVNRYIKAMNGNGGTTTQQPTTQQPNQQTPYTGNPHADALLAAGKTIKSTDGKLYKVVNKKLTLVGG